MSDIETRQKKLPVLLFIRGEQYFDDVDPDATELTTPRAAWPVRRC